MVEGKLTTASFPLTSTQVHIINKCNKNIFLKKEKNLIYSHSIDEEVRALIPELPPLCSDALH